MVGRERELAVAAEVAAALILVHATASQAGWKSVRGWVLPVGATALLGYRSISGGSGDLLSEVVALVESASRRAGNGTGARLAKDALGLAICSGIFSLILQTARGFGTSSSGSLLTRKGALEYLYQLATELPVIGAALNKELAKEAAKLEAEFEADLKISSRAIAGCGGQHASLPLTGIAPSEILQLMKVETAKENVVWQTGHVSGAVYHGVAEHQEFLNQAFGLYSIANPLHPDIWPSGMKFESEIIACTASLVAPEGKVYGSTTSGGTESIILAIKAHRDFYRKKYRITSPELVCCVSAHAAVDKACDLMNIKLIKVPMNSQFKADVGAIRNAIGPNTIMIYASAPSYPQGTIDDIGELSGLAQKYAVGLHVDCCLGGFVLPFMRKLGYPVPAFDFSLPGVSSMSLDTHKYGFALKGASVVLYRTKELRQAQYFCYPDWTGGMYTTPTIAGSRSGGLIAQCWASLMAIGQEGYLKHTKDIVEATRFIAEGVKEIEGLTLLGNAEAMIVCFGAAAGTPTTINVYCVADNMSKRGWSLNSLQNPACVHLCITVRHIGHEKSFLKDLRESVQQVREAASKGTKLDGKAAIYGMTSNLPSGPVASLLKVYNDVVLKL